MIYDGCLYAAKRKMPYFAIGHWQSSKECAPAIDHEDPQQVASQRSSKGALRYVTKEHKWRNKVKKRDEKVVDSESHVAQQTGG